jgi:hypothetical protein
VQIYGNYPDIINVGIDQTRLYLDQLCSQYLYKDVLSFETLKNPKAKHKIPNDFLKTYDKNSFSFINTNNCWDFILP